MVGPAAWGAVVLLTLAIVLALAFTEKTTIARPLRPMNQCSSLAPAVVDPQLAGAFAASRKIWAAIRPTTSRLLVPHASQLDEPFERTTELDLRHMLSDMTDQSRRGYPAFLGPCPCPVREQPGPLATE